MGGVKVRWQLSLEFKTNSPWAKKRFWVLCFIHKSIKYRVKMKVFQLYSLIYSVFSDLFYCPDHLKVKLVWSWIGFILKSKLPIMFFGLLIQYIYKCRITILGTTNSQTTSISYSIFIFPSILLCLKYFLLHFDLKTSLDTNAASSTLCQKLFEANFLRYILKHKFTNTLQAFHAQLHLLRKTRPLLVLWNLILYFTNIDKNIQKFDSLVMDYAEKIAEKTFIWTVNI